MHWGCKLSGASEDEELHLSRSCVCPGTCHMALKYLFELMDPRMFY